MTVKEYNSAVDEHADSLYRFILKNIKHIDTAQDIVQDTFEKLWLRLEGVDAGKVKSYLFTTAYHTMIDYIRKNKHTGDIEDIDMERHSHNQQYSDLKEILNKAIENLPEDQRSVLMLRDYEGYSYKEIAEITGLSESVIEGAES
jgi:RNA polymerase sigma factor (sigma-70 family)